MQLENKINNKWLLSITYIILNMPTFLEPIGAGLIVALINKFIINNQHLFDYCKGDNEVVIEIDDAVSSTTSSTTDAIEIHAHF